MQKSWVRITPELFAYEFFPQNLGKYTECSIIQAVLSLDAEGIQVCDPLLDVLHSSNLIPQMISQKTKIFPLPSVTKEGKKKKWFSKKRFAEYNKGIFQLKLPHIWMWDYDGCGSCMVSHWIQIGISLR